MLWRFRKEIIFVVLVIFSFLIGRKYYIRESKKKNVNMRERILNYKEIIEENKRLREILKLKREKDILTNFIVGEVVRIRPSVFPAEIVVNKGRKDGIVENMIVLTKDFSLIGRVENVEENLSRIMTVFNSKSKISVIVNSTREIGILEGGYAPFLLLKYISYDSGVKPGDEVITSGYSGFYPEGIKVGKIISVERMKKSLFLKIYVKPYSCFSSLDEVLIGKKKSFINN